MSRVPAGSTGPDAGASSSCTGDGPVSHFRDIKPSYARRLNAGVYDLCRPFTHAAAPFRINMISKAYHPSRISNGSVHIRKASGADLKSTSSGTLSRQQLRQAVAEMID